MNGVGLSGPILAMLPLNRWCRPTTVLIVWPLKSLQSFSRAKALTEQAIEAHLDLATILY